MEVDVFVEYTPRKGDRVNKWEVADLLKDEVIRLRGHHIGSGTMLNRRIDMQFAFRSFKSADRFGKWAVDTLDSLPGSSLKNLRVYLRRDYV